MTGDNKPVAKLVEKIEKVLQSADTAGFSEDDAVALLAAAKQMMKQDAASGKVLGKYISIVDKAIKAHVVKIDIHFEPVAAGFLAIGHKPGGKLPYDGLKRSGVAAIVTLLQEHEGAPQIGRQVQQAGMKWIWLPFSASAPHSGTQCTQVTAVYEQLKIDLSQGGKIYIHCSAGIHRTGMITYGLLRFLGYTAPQAKEMLQQLRPVTASQVGEDRLLWGDQFAPLDKNIF